MNRHVILREILEREFTEVAAREGRHGAFTDSEMAKRLRTSPAQLSYLLRGQRRLTPDLALRFAESLHPDEGPARSAMLRSLNAVYSAPETLRDFEDRLLAVTGPAELSPDTAGRAFFQLIAAKGWFLCVEYRDLPRATDRYRSLADAAGKAVAEGLCFAMIQPFGTDFSSAPAEPGLPRMTLLFMEKLALKVREVHAAMLDAAADALEGRVPSPRDEANKRLVLFERQGRPAVGTGIQSRLFYCEHEDADRERAVFEWIAGERGDMFFRRTGPIDTDAFAGQFAPILWFWRENHRLPRSSDDLVGAVALANRKEKGANFPPNLWVIHEP